MHALVATLARFVAVVHVVCGVLLGVGAASTFAPVLAHPPAGDAGRLLALPLVIALLIALWLVTLGVWTWRSRPAWRAALRGTHAVVGVLALGNVGLGWIAMRGAARSAAHGGGLLGGLGELQIGVGLLMALVAALSLALVHLTGRADAAPSARGLHR